MADNSTASVSCLPNTTYDVSDVSRALISANKILMPLNYQPLLLAKAALLSMASQ
jgi:hypothetical protein